jgi:quercetin dioxygenase-like cupin family protein
MKPTLFFAATLLLASQAGSRAASSPVTYLPAAQVTAAFEKGMPLIETDGYKVHASRREGPGMAEIHTRDTDIIYVLQGTATIVTGGDAVNAKMTADNELRGTSIAGGERRLLTKGDVFIVPNGVPHLFAETSNPFLYYVVKATAPKTGGTQ